MNLCSVPANWRISFPCVLPFSQMYPLCCIDIRNFLNQFYFFSNDDFPHTSTIDETLKNVWHDPILILAILVGANRANGDAVPG